MKFRQRIEFIDPNGVLIEAFEVTGQTDPTNEDTPGDPAVYHRVLDRVGEFAAAMACEGLAFEVRATNLCAYPGCDAPADIGGLCLPDARSAAL